MASMSALVERPGLKASTRTAPPAASTSAPPAMSSIF
jgi:hypothetical protein